jgi:hypothetical protein
MLGIGESRWRQITAARPDPDPILGERIKRVGTRGSVWTMRGVLNYALAQRHNTTELIPPLLPMPDGEARYQSILGQVFGAPATASLTDPYLGLRAPSAFAEMFVPTSYALCGHPQPPLLLLTGLWSEGASTTFTPWGVTRHVVEALQVPGWKEVLDRDQPRLAVAIVPTAWDSWPDDADVNAYEYDPSVLFLILDRLRDEGMRRLQRGVDARNPPSAEYRVPATDVAACLGWSHLPYWPTGTATIATCTAWSPGAPLEIGVPASLSRNLEIGRWIAEQARSSEADQAGGNEAADDLTALAATFDPVTPGIADRHHWNPEVPEGLEVAVRINWPEPMPLGSRTASPWIALDRLYSDPDTPPAMAVDMHRWLGDPAYAPPATWRFAEIPEAWVALFRAAAKGPNAPQDNPRLRRLFGAAGDAAPESLTANTFGPLKAPAVMTSEEVVWLPPTGFSTQRGADDRPATALPQDDGASLFEALFLRDQSTRIVGGWARTVTGELVPLPTKSQWGKGDEWSALILTAALEDLTLSQIQDASRRSRGAALDENGSDRQGPPMHRLLQNVGAQPVTVLWHDLLIHARETWEILNR